MSSAEALNYPNCGGAVAAEKTKCGFCGSRLKTVGCAACLGMMFLGSKFCGHCGKAAHPARLLESDDSGDCPRCRTALQALEIGEVSIRECERCAGFWSDAATFEAICADKERQAAVIGFSGSYTHPVSNLSTISYVPCPDCKQLMNRSNFARSSGVIVDMCKQHGVWFDADELPKIIDFIDKGGLDRSREKERIALQDERARLRDEERRLAMMSRRSGGGNFDDKELDGGLGGIIGRLFDL